MSRIAGGNALKSDIVDQLVIAPTPYLYHRMYTGQFPEASNTCVGCHTIYQHYVVMVPRTIMTMKLDPSVPRTASDDISVM